MTTFLILVIVVTSIGMLASIVSMPPYEPSPTPEAVWKYAVAKRRFKFFFAIFLLAAFVLSVFFDPALGVSHR